MKQRISKHASAGASGGKDEIFVFDLRLSHASACAAFLTFFALCWLTLIAWLSLSPPIDNAEQITWARDLAWGYYKHPPLPTAILAPLMALFPFAEWVPAALGASLTMFTMWWLWRWVAQEMGSSWAWVCLLAMLCVNFYTFRLQYYNHNIILLLFYALAARLTWDVSLQTLPSKRYFVALGVLMGSAMLSKYQAILFVVPMAGVLWQSGFFKRSVNLVRLAMAVGVSLLILTPHLIWLLQHDYLPFRYAQHSSWGLT